MSEADEYADFSSQCDEVRLKMRQKILASDDAELRSLYYRSITLSEHEAGRRMLLRQDAMIDALKHADAAINPPDRDGISMETWNGRLKIATAMIRAALAVKSTG